MQRLIGLVPPEFSDREDLQFDDIRSQIEPQLDIKVTEVNWFSRCRVHHRVADHFRQGNAFLLGDAGHIHSPAGGQGMNTGIGDAINLGWKLAHVLQKRADPALLDTYEPERIAFARTLVSSTDRAFTAMTGADLRGEFTRQLVAPLVFFLGTRVIPHVLFRRYRKSRFVIQTARSAKEKLEKSAAATACLGPARTWITLLLCAPSIGKFTCMDNQPMIWQALATRSDKQSSPFPGIPPHNTRDLSATRPI
jgi:hypothetical protein